MVEIVISEECEVILLAVVFVVKPEPELEPEPGVVAVFASCFQEGVWVRHTPPAGATPSPATPVAKRPSVSPSEPICLDSLEEELKVPSLDSISQALAILGSAAKGLAQGDNPPSPDAPRTTSNPPPLHTSPLVQQQKKMAVSTPGAGAPHYISTSSSPSAPLARPPATTSSPLPSVRADGTGGIKGVPQAHRHSVLNTPRTLGAVKVGMSASASSLKPRPPPTASPLVAPGPKSGVLSPPPSGLLKGSGSNNNNNNKAQGGEGVILTSRTHTLNSKTFYTARLPLTPHTKSSPSPSLPQTQPQSNFITPMHATLTKSTHSSVPPIVKLTPRAPNPAVTTAPPSSPAVSQNPRSQVTPSLHQYSPQTQSGFRPSFSGGAQGGATKPGQSSYAPPNSTNTTSLINTSSISKHSGSGAPPSVNSASSGPRPRPGGVAKSVTSVSSSSVSSQLPQVGDVAGFWKSVV